MAIKSTQLHKFVVESNKIEGITREPRDYEIEVHRDFLALKDPRVADLANVAKILAGGVVRSQPGMDVRVGDYTPPPGGSEIEKALNTMAFFLGEVSELKVKDRWAWNWHKQFECLHPFTDGNGRTGRLGWAWMMIHGEIDPGIELGFLHAYYYQTLRFA